MAVPLRRSEPAARRLRVLEDSWPWALAAVALALGLSWNSRESMWLDEATSERLATMPWRSFADEVASEQINMSAYFLLLRGWVTIGSDEGVLRAFSAVASAATVPVLYAVGRRLLKPWEAAVACLLLVVNPGFVSFAQEVRGYAMSGLFVTLATLLLMRYVEKPSLARAGAYALAIALAVYSHLFALFILGAHAAAFAAHIFVASSERRTALIAGTKCLVCVGALLIPLGIYAATGDSSHLGWVQRPSLRDLAAAFPSLAGSRPLAVLLAALALIGTLQILSVRSREGRWARWCLIGWFLLPILGSYAVSVALKPILVPRYLMVALPAWVLLAAAGLGSIHDYRRRTAAVGVVVAVSLVALSGVYRDRVNDDWRGAVGVVAASVSAGDSIVFDPPYGRVPFGYYARRHSHIFARARSLVPDEPWGGYEPGQTQHLNLRALSHDAGRRAWLVSSFTVDPRARQRLESALAAGRHATRTVLRGVDVTLFSR